MPANLPKPLPTSGGRFSNLFKWLNQLRAYVESTTVRQGINYTAYRGSKGTLIRPKGKGGGSGGGGNNRAVWL